MWCPNDKNAIMSSSGQINLKDIVGMTLYTTIKNNNIDNIVDLGTWNGLGSTLCFIEYKH